MDDIHTRILQIIKEKAGNASIFADEIGVQRSSISHILSGRNKPSVDFLQKVIARYSDIDMQWVLSGKKGMLLEDENKTRVNIVNSDISSNISQQSKIQNEDNIYQTSNSNSKNGAMQDTKRIDKVLIFYTDKTFTEYYPE